MRQTIALVAFCVFAGALSAAAETPAVAPGMRAVMAVVASDAVGGGFVLPNDRVDVVLADKTTGRIIEIFLSNVRVLDIDSGNPKKATLELSTSHAEILTRAKRRGVLSLQLRSITDTETASDSAKPTKSGSSVVRFGIIPPKDVSKETEPAASSAAARLAAHDAPLADKDEACSKLAVVVIMDIAATDIPRWVDLCAQHPNGGVCREAYKVIQEQGSKLKLVCQGKVVDSFDGKPRKTAK